MDDNFPYEIHFTLDGVNDINQLQKDCEEIGNLKLIILDLYGKKKTENQVTTSSYVPSNSSNSVWSTSMELRRELRKRNYTISRVKYETVPWHPYVENVNPKRFDRKEIYFETHYKWLVHIDDLEEFRNTFKSLTRLSRNTLKHNIIDHVSIMGTVRTYGKTYDSHKEVLEQEEKLFTIPFTKKISEFAFHDTNRSLDTSWLR